MQLLPFQIDKARLEQLMAGVAGWGWLYEWGMFLFLLVTLAVVAWVFIDSVQKRVGARALAPRILSIVGVVMIIPVFLFRYTGGADGTSVVVQLNGEQPKAILYTGGVDWNVGWLVGGWGPRLAVIALLGVAVSVLAFILYQAMVTRQRPSTEFVSAINNQFGQLRQEIRSSRVEPQAAPAAAVDYGQPAPVAVPAPAPSRSAATVIAPEAGRRSAPTVIDQGARSFAELRVVSGKSSGQRWELPARDIKIGREVDNFVSIDDERSSREHAKIRCQEGEFTILDLGSANGTLVNERRIEGPTKLNDGDTIKIGDTDFVFKVVLAN